VTRVDNGADAVQRSLGDGARPDVVLMDNQMPGMDGLEAARQIRALETAHGLGRVPIVAMTASITSEDRLRCKEAGMDHFVGKPFTEVELLDVLGASLVPMAPLAR
jgi:CheY-like chemotaxis protein